MNLTCAVAQSLWFSCSISRAITRCYAAYSDDISFALANSAVALTHTRLLFSHSNFPILSCNLSRPLERSFATARSALCMFIFGVVPSDQ
mmetsp:Transcript_33009/g.53141  ORF Transcript_33009/g.53141 Transcript_33009/m.53141 type:complete len:90 (+) Transcript_33009:503-772(+)